MTFVFDSPTSTFWILKLRAPQKYVTNFASVAMFFYAIRESGFVLDDLV